MPVLRHQPTLRMGLFEAVVIRWSGQCRRPVVPIDNVATRLFTALLVAISGGVHLRLYLDGYRDIHVESVLGIDLSRSFLLSVLAALVVAELLAVSALRARLATPAYLAAVLYAAGSLAAFALSRTTGLLGFEEHGWDWQSVVAVGSALLTLAIAGIALVARLTNRAPAPATQS